MDVRWGYNRSPVVVLVLAALFVGLAAARATAATVPFVVCNNSENGPPSSVPPATINVDLPDAAARQLAFYAGDLTGVLAPRGWVCQNDGGAGGYIGLSVFPSLKNFDESVTAGAADTSSPGSALDVSQYICRYFFKSQYKDRAAPTCQKGKWISQRDVADMGDFTKPFPANPRDRLTYINEDMVQYYTPAHTTGLGTMSAYYDPTNDYAGKTYSQPTFGFLIVGTFSGGVNQMEDGVVQKFDVRLPESLKNLTGPILDFAKACYLAGNQGVCIQNPANSQAE